MLGNKTVSQISKAFLHLWSLIFHNIKKRQVINMQTNK